MQELAKERGGRCLAKRYVNSRTKYPWECAKKHRWEAMWVFVKRGTWCRECGIKRRADALRLSISDVQKIAKERGGECLSKTYINARTPLLFKCAKGHRFDATYDNVRTGHWCRHCGWKKSAEAKKPSIEEMRDLARKRGGKFLSDTYISSDTKHLWECADGHLFKATPDKVKQGRWCYKCSSGFGERVCREFFEQIFERKFPKSYPRWLVNAKGNQMELDGYCPALKVAFEHHGEQHYSTTSRFIKSKERLRERQKDDELKRQLCDRRRIVLVEVPEIPNRLPLEEIRAFIRKECELKGVSLPDDFDAKEIDLRNAYATSRSREALKEAQVIAAARGGRCLSDQYIKARTHLVWECAKEHQWKATLYSVKNDRTWCPHCAGKMKLTIEEMQQLAKKRGGKCLSDTYVNVHTKLLWECARGHRWKAIPTNIRHRRRWCPYCAGNIKLTIEQMRRIAKKRGGECLSDSYVNNHTKLLWRCGEGHQWEAIPNSTKRGTWCPLCAGKRKLTIEDMRQLARGRDGKCLSDTYVNTGTKLLWKCSESHIWPATPDKIKQGRWCPECAKLRRRKEVN
jgi:hypothetical protein